jgi:hypothetical protein
MRQSKGEALCPRCGGANLTYKNVFDYYKCNDCGVTFITPVYSYGQQERPGLDSAKEVASKIFGEARLEEPESGTKKPETRIKEPEVRPGRVRKANSQTWIIVLLLIIILILILVIVWMSNGNQITDLFSGLL